MTLGVQAKLLVWATSDRGRFTLREATRLALTLLPLAAVIFRPWVAPWLVALWALTRAFTTVRDYRMWVRVFDRVEAQAAAPQPDCRVWIDRELVWAARVDADHVRLLNCTVEGGYRIGDVVGVWPGNHPDEYFLDDTEQKERAR